MRPNAFATPLFYAPFIAIATPIISTLTLAVAALGHAVPLPHRAVPFNAFASHSGSTPRHRQTTLCSSAAILYVSSPCLCSSTQFTSLPRNTVAFPNVTFRFIAVAFLYFVKNYLAFAHPDYAIPSRCCSSHHLALPCHCSAIRTYAVAVLVMSMLYHCFASHIKPMPSLRVSSQCCSFALLINACPLISVLCRCQTVQFFAIAVRLAALPLLNHSLRFNSIALLALLFIPRPLQLNS